MRNEQTISKINDCKLYFLIGNELNNFFFVVFFRDTLSTSVLSKYLRIMTRDTDAPILFFALLKGF